MVTATTIYRNSGIEVALANALAALNSVVGPDGLVCKITAVWVVPALGASWFYRRLRGAHPISPRLCRGNLA
jgi:hypothetical protein